MDPAILHAMRFSSLGTPDYMLTKREFSIPSLSLPEARVLVENLRGFWRTREPASEVHERIGVSCYATGVSWPPNAWTERIEVFGPEHPLVRVSVHHNPRTLEQVEERIQYLSAALPFD